MCVCACVSSGRIATKLGEDQQKTPPAQSQSDDNEGRRWINCDRMRQALSVEDRPAPTSTVGSFTPCTTSNAGRAPLLRRVHPSQKRMTTSTTNIDICIHHSRLSGGVSQGILPTKYLERCEVYVCFMSDSTRFC